MTVITLTGREFVKDQSEWVRLQVKNDGQVIPEDELAVKLLPLTPELMRSLN